MIDQCILRRIIKLPSQAISRCIGPTRLECATATGVLTTEDQRIVDMKTFERAKSNDNYSDEANGKPLKNSAILCSDHDIDRRYLGVAGEDERFI